MNILIINTAFDDADYIVINNGKNFCKKATKLDKHSESALPFIDELLQQAKLAISDIDVFAVNIGPGSFTGIRIGVALLKGFASVLTDKKIVVFNSFEPVAISNKSKSPILIKASKDDYYAGLNEDGKIKKCFIITNEDVLKENNALEFNGTYNDEDLIALINKKIQDKEFSTINDTNPLYLKLSQAEKELLKKEQNNVD